MAVELKEKYIKIKNSLPFWSSLSKSDERATKNSSVSGLLSDEKSLGPDELDGAGPETIPKEVN